MGYPAKTERNDAIVAAYKAGRAIEHIAADHEISWSRARFIIDRAGALGTVEERKRRIREINRRTMSRPEVVEAKREKMRQHWRFNPAMGKRRLFADNPVKREEYLLLRDAVGCKEAREIMGLGK